MDRDPGAPRSGEERRLEIHNTCTSSHNFQRFTKPAVAEGLCNGPPARDRGGFRPGSPADQLTVLGLGNFGGIFFRCPTTPHRLYCLDNTPCRVLYVTKPSFPQHEGYSLILRPDPRCVTRRYLNILCNGQCVRGRQRRLSAPARRHALRLRGGLLQPADCRLHNRALGHGILIGKGLDHGHSDMNRGATWG